MRLICLGLGYSAREFVARHGERFSHIAATCRDPAKAQAILEAGYTPIRMDGTSDGALASAIAASDVLLLSAGPSPARNGGADDPFLAVVAQALTGAPKGKRLLYLSTVGVYGDHGGAWVDEATTLRPVSERSLLRAKTEVTWLQLGDRLGQRVDIFRLAGIYGPGRSAIDTLREGTARRLVKPGQVFNRIHVRDIADTLAAALDYTGPQRIWNVTDNEPAPPQDVVAYGAKLLGMEPPPEMDFATAVLSPMARSFYGENKRVSNRAIREVLGVRLNYPTYREGLESLL